MSEPQPSDHRRASGAGIATTAPWRDRIVGQGEESPAALVANPKNWRTHPKVQQDALSGVLDQVGWVQQVLVNRLTGRLVDGHLRVEGATSARAWLGVSRELVRTSRRGSPRYSLMATVESKRSRRLGGIAPPDAPARNGDRDRLHRVLPRARRGADGRRALATARFAKTEVESYQRMFYELTPARRHRTRLRRGAARTARTGNSCVMVGARGIAPP